jgi:hypothetical protein
LFLHASVSLACSGRSIHGQQSCHMGVQAILYSSSHGLQWKLRSCLATRKMIRLFSVGALVELGTSDSSHTHGAPLLNDVSLTTGFRISYTGIAPSRSRPARARCQSHSHCCVLPCDTPQADRPQGQVYSRTTFKQVPSKFLQTSTLSPDVLYVKITLLMTEGRLG